jgi:2,4-diaminopentanoate dehydrogenase
VTDVVSLGLGPIGVAIAEAVLSKANVKLVGAVDVNEALVGQSVSQLLPGAPAGLTISSDIEAALSWDKDGVVIQATASRLQDVAPQLEAIVGCGWNVVSTSEELTNPRAVDPIVARRLDFLAKEAGVTVLGAGVNPGFLMDALPLVLTGLCRRVDAISVQRIVDTNHRRSQLQQKVGVGMTQEEFAARANEGRLGHVGLRQSAFLIASALGWTNVQYRETLRAVVAEEETITPIGVVRRGDVIGQRQLATIDEDGEKRVRLELEMYAGAKDEDRIEITGEPPIRQAIAGGINGDTATASVIANLVEPVARAASGLATMTDILAVACKPSLAVSVNV